MHERSTRSLTAVLLLANACFGAVVVLELIAEAGVVPKVTAAAHGAALETRPEATSFQPPPDWQFDEISKRPLFFPSRRPFVPPAVVTDSESTPAADPRVRLELIGVLLTERRRAALVQPQGDASARWIHERQSVAGWLVEEIAADRVRLRIGDRVQVVKLRPDQAGAPGEPRTR